MKGGILRIIAVNFVCVFLVLYSFYSYISPDVIAEKKESEVIVSQKNDTSLDKSDKKQEIEESSKEAVTSSKVNSSKASTSSKPVSAEAVKGKVISRYISPYNTSLSYDKVYVKNSTNLQISIKNFLSGKIKFSIKKNNEPQVLILHTHATETFMEEDAEYFTEEFSSRSRDNTKNMVAVGSIVAKKLNDAGIKTIHSKTLHDYPSYTASYSRAADTICGYLEKYPSIKVVLDLHRDAVTDDDGNKIKLTTEIDGKKAAQVMLVMGSQSGSVTNFPKWQENFKLAVKLQQIMEKNYPTLARPIMLMSKNYNESLTTGSLLLEFGTDVNSLDEVFYSAQMVGDSIVELLNSLT